ncbi:MAG: acyltransferase family protein [Acidobacteriota bacterium]
MQTSSDRGRIVFLDWLRGLAAIIMLQGHTFNSFIRPEELKDGWYEYSQYFGGQAAAVFLFVTGITYGLGMTKRESLPLGQRFLAALRRSRYLFILAFMFRVQMYVFGYPQSQLSDLLTVDILNAMGAGLLLLSVLALISDNLRRARWAVLAGVAFAGLAPVMSGLDTSQIPDYLRAYFVPRFTFSLFPWGAFLALGCACGSVLTLVPRGSWDRVMQWIAVVGFALIMCGLYMAGLPYSIYSNAEFWLDSPALVACKLGAIFLMASGSFLWTEYLSTGWSWVRVLGTASLPVYWVHVELVYGRWFPSFKERLTWWQCVLFSICLIWTMVGMALVLKQIPWRKWLSNGSPSAARARRESLQTQTQPPPSLAVRD